jgi:glycosyltransferase involved in cell wall biosynthesis
VIVSDDFSTDETMEVVPPFLEASGLDYKLLRQERNLGYDQNLRSALRAATGDYLMILGNDDRLPDPDTLKRLSDVLERYNHPAVAFGNCQEFGQGPSPRATRTQLLGSGPDVALKTFRKFTVVMGIIFAREAYHAHDTDKFDGSVYVQIYLASRIIAAGGTLLAIADVIAETGIHVGKRSPTYVDKLRNEKWRFRLHTGGLDQVGRVAYEAIEPYVPSNGRQSLVRKIFRQLLTTSYPLWLYTYRKDAGWGPAFNLACGCYPPNLTHAVPHTTFTSAALGAYHTAYTFAGLLTPLGVLGPIKGALQRARNALHW